MSARYRCEIFVGGESVKSPLDICSQPARRYLVSWTFHAGNGAKAKKTRIMHLCDPHAQRQITRERTVTAIGKGERKLETAKTDVSKGH